MANRNIGPDDDLYDEHPLVDATDTRPPHARLNWAEDAPGDIPPPLDDAWILHNGGPRPVPPDTLVWVDNGTGAFRGPAPASTFEWVDGEWDRVHSYRRVVDPDAPTGRYSTDEAIRREWLNDHGWIENTTGVCPVQPDTKVRVMFENGETSDATPAGDWEWPVGDGEHHIAAYQILNQPKSDAPTDHYRQGDIECIDAIRAALTDEEWRGYCKGNVLKYTWREKHKGGDETLVKAQDYLRWALAGKAEGKR